MSQLKTNRLEGVTTYLGVGQHDSTNLCVKRSVGGTTVEMGEKNHKDSTPQVRVYLSPNWGH